MDTAIKEAKKALEKGNIPVGTLIVKENEIIAKAYNQSFWHAEILCIQKAQKKIGRNLSNTILFSTLEPCPMCRHAIKLAKIPTVISGASNLKEINYTLEIIKNIREETCSELLKKYFEKKR